MRIQQLVKSFSANSKLRPEQSVGSPRALAGASRANQARITDSAKGFIQAATIRDGIAKVSDSLDRAREALKKVQDPNVSAADKKKLQDDFAKAFTELDQGSKSQASAIADQSLVNHTFDAKRAGVTAAADLGKGASIQFKSVVEVKKLDLTTASSDQLAEAAKVLDAAKTETGQRLTTADTKINAISGRLDVFQEVQASLDGAKQATSADNKKRDIDSLRALIEHNQSLVPGSIFSSLG